MSEQNSEPRPFDPPVPPTAPPAAPTEPPAAPPAPPAAPEPERPAVPQYGEYAPAGYVSPVSTPAAPAVPANPYGVPGYAAPATPSNMYGAPAVAAPAYAPLVRKRRTWDVVLTIILLVLGLFGMGFGLIYAWLFTQPELFREAMASQGLGTFSGDFGSASTVIAVSHIALFVVAAALSIFLLARGRIVVFWIPLVAGVVAAAIFWVTLIGVFASDPGFINRVGG